MCPDARVLPHKLVNMNMNQNDKGFQNSELNFHREKEHVWVPHVSDTIIFFTLIEKFISLTPSFRPSFQKLIIFGFSIT